MHGSVDAMSANIDGTAERLARYRAGRFEELRGALFLGEHAMLRKHPLLAKCVASCLAMAAVSTSAKEVETLELGSPAPELNLPGVDDHTYRVVDFADAKLLVVVFTCNHCPTARPTNLAFANCMTTSMIKEWRLSLSHPMTRKRFAWTSWAIRMLGTRWPT